MSPVEVRTLARVAGMTAVVVFVGLAVLGAPLRTGAAPLGIVSLQLATSPAAADAVVAAWTGHMLVRAALLHGADFLLPVAYATAIMLAARLLAARQPSSPRGHGRSATTLAGGSALLAAIADQTENVAMAVTLLAGSSWASVLVTLAAAVVKFAALPLALGALGVAAVRARSGSGATSRADGDGAGHR
jgi:hypothetical protein